MDNVTMMVGEFTFWLVNDCDLKNICKKIKKLMDVNLKNYGSPLEPGDHPEMDETEFLTGDDISQYQMLVGSTQWAITMGRYDIPFSVNSMQVLVVPQEMDI
jgi:hypothetical protein